MIIAGIDPGLSGAIAVIRGADGDADVWPMPIIEGQGLDGRKIIEILRDEHPDHVWIEKAQAMPKQGVTSMFTYGVGYGRLLGIIETLGIPMSEVRPRKWKDAMLADMDKSAKGSSILRARQLFPAVDFRPSDRCRKDHDGMCEAILIAEYGRRQLSFPMRVAV